MDKYYEIFMSEAAKGTESVFAVPTLGTDISSGSDRKTYGLLVDTVKNDSAEIAEASDRICSAYRRFVMDHPELFWLTEDCRTCRFSRRDTASVYLALYSYNNVTRQKDYDIRADIYDSVERIRGGISLRDASIAKILADHGIGSHRSAVENVALINRALVTSNQFYCGDGSNLSMNDSTNCLSALKGSVGNEGPLCTGYAKAFKVLCDRVGIPCRLVLGDAVPSVGAAPYRHMWNAVNIGGAWYGVDVTWNDPYTRTAAAESGYENEKYLLVGNGTVIDGQAFGQTHIADGPTLSITAYSRG